MTAMQARSFDMAMELPPKVQGGSAWYGSEMQNSSEWLYQLTAVDIAEIKAAAKPLADAEADIAKITKDDFPLPTVGPKLGAIFDDVLNGRGFALLRGLPVERWSIRQSATAYYGIGAYLGHARSQNDKGHILGHVRDLGRDAVNDPTARIYQTR